MKNIPKIALLVTVPVLTACLLWTIANGAKNEATSNANTVIDDVTVPVNTSNVVSATIPQEVTALGSLSAVQKVTVSAQTDGVVFKIYFKNGQEVGQGMPILQQDDTQAKVDYQSAVSDLELARKTYERDLQVGDAISQQQLEEAKADVDSKEADVKSKLNLLNQKEITAPFDGVLGDIQVNEGDYIKSGSAIVSLVNTKQLRANYALPQDLIPLLKVGQLVKITVAAYPQKIFYGTVSYISPTVDPTTRTYALQAVVPNSDGLLSPGMFVHVAEQISTVKNALVIPEQAVLTDVKGNYVYKVDGKRASKVYVSLGAHTNGVVQVQSGLALNDAVITAGQQKLQEGTLIKVVNTGPNESKIS